MQKSAKNIADSDKRIALFMLNAFIYKSLIKIKKIVIKFKNMLQWEIR